MIPQTPFNITPLDVDNFIKQNGLLEVSSQLIWEPSSTTLHPDGLYSEGIFGQLGTPERYSRIGFISLNTKILAPLIFKNTIDIRPIYSDIMESKVYARFDEISKDFIVTEKGALGSDTGYHFFISHFDKIQFPFTKSHTRTTKIKTIDIAREKGCAIIERMLVLPAGMRDIKQENGQFTVEEINKVYNSLLSLCFEVKNNLSSPMLNKVYDGVKYNIQLKVLELYNHHKEFLNGKTGFAQRRYARRALVYGTRNVITGANLSSTHPTASENLKQNETLVPLFQGIKMYQPLIIHQLRTLFYSQVFSTGIVRVAGIDPKNFNVEYVDVSDSEIDKILSSSALEDLINLFQNIHFRIKPVTFKSADNKIYYLFLVYDAGSEIYILRNKDDFKEFMSQQNKTIDPKNFRPLTYLEMFYLAAYKATNNKHCTVTRYPAIEMGSIYPSKCKLGTTSPSRKIKFASQYRDNYFVELPAYPIVGNPYIDSTIVHPSQVRGLGADYDGDTISVNGILSDDANSECSEYLKQAQNFLDSNGNFLKSAATDLTELTFFNLTNNPQLS